MSEDMDLERPLALFSLLPETIAPEDLDAWAAAGARSLAEGSDWADDDEQLERTAFMLAHLQALPRRPSFELRFLFLAHPSIAASIWDVALLAPSGEVDDALPRLVGSGSGARLEETTEWFEVDGHRVCQRLAMDDLEPEGVQPTGDVLTERVLQATVAIAVRRELPLLGTTDVLAFASTSHLESLFASLEATRILITGDVLPEEVAAAGAAH